MTTQRNLKLQFHFFISLLNLNSPGYFLPANAFLPSSKSIDCVLRGNDLFFACLFNRQQTRRNGDLRRQEISLKKNFKTLTAQEVCVVSPLVVPSLYLERVSQLLFLIVAKQSSLIV
jgi:hypothetical protein